MIIATTRLTLSLKGGYSLTFMDEFVDQLLNEERVCDIILPRIQKREVLEENGDIGPRKSLLLDAMEGKSDHGSARSKSRSRSGSKSPIASDTGYKSRSPSRSRSRSGDRYRSERSYRRKDELDKNTETFIRMVASVVKERDADFEQKLKEQEIDNPKYQFLADERVSLF